jgi:hypothetical protein
MAGFDKRPQCLPVDLSKQKDQQNYAYADPQKNHAYLFKNPHVIDYLINLSN